MMDYFQRKTLYLNLMKACLRTQAAGNSIAAIAAFNDLEKFGITTAREYRNTCDPELKEGLAEVCQDVISFFRRQAQSHNSFGDTVGAHFLWESEKKIKEEAEKQK